MTKPAQKKSTSKKSISSSKKKSPKSSKLDTKNVVQNPLYNGVLDISARSFDLAAVGEKFIKKFVGARSNFRVVWAFMNYPTTTTPQVAIVTRQVDIRHTSSYEVSLNEPFFKYLSNRPITFEVFVLSYKQEILLGKGDVILNDILSKPNEKLNAKIEISNLEKALLVNNPNLFRVYGHLNIDYELKCDITMLYKLMEKKFKSMSVQILMKSILENLPKNKFGGDECVPYDLPEPPSQMEAEGFKPKCKGKIKTSTKNNVNCAGSKATFEDQTTTAKPRKKRKILTIKANTDHSSSEEYVKLVEKVAAKGNLVPCLDANKKEESNVKLPVNLILKDKPKTEDHNTKNNEKPKPLPPEQELAKIRRCLEEYAILSGEDPTIINSPLWREHNLHKVYVRSFKNDCCSFEPQVLIHIHYLKLYDNAPPLLDKTIKSFYLEYQFLTKEGVEMESSSILKTKDNTPLKFNFKKTFDIDLLKNFSACKLLANMMKQKKNVVIEVISEPVDDMKEVQSCEIAGYCEVCLFDLLQLEENVLKAKFEVKNFQNPAENLGYIRVTIGGIQAMRNISLQLLAPTEYKAKLKYLKY